MNRNSANETDGVTVANVGFRIGADGVDLRERQQPPSLTKLINARFLDERTVARRSGHTGTRVSDKAGFPVALPGQALNPTDWVYGHGSRISTLGISTLSESSHYPHANRGGQVVDDAGTVWTGDRLILPGGYGSSTAWYKATTTLTNPLNYGIPAYLPTMVDQQLPAAVDGRQHMATCLSSDSRFVVYQSSTALYAIVLTRSGTFVSSTKLNTTGSSPLDAEVFLSNGVPTCVWRDSGTGDSYYSYYTGSWSSQAVLVSTVANFHIVNAGNGWYFFWRSGSVIKVTYYTGLNSAGVPAAQSAPLAAATVLNLSSTIPNDKLAADVAPDGSFTVAWLVSGTVYARMYTAAGANLSTAVALSAPASYSLSVGMYALKSDYGYYDALVYCADTNLGIAGLRWNGSSLLTSTTTRYNARLASHAFRVGNELFAWAQSNCGGSISTNFLISGMGAASGGMYGTVCGFSERSEAVLARDNFGNYTIVRVLPDPLNAYSFSFARPKSTSYLRAGSCKVGDMNFLPTLSVAKYGQSAYLSGCAVRNWDGEKLAEAGFYDVVSATGVASTSGGFLSNAGSYSIRAYIVRYNKAGERFQSQALTSSAVTTSSATASITWTIKTCPSMTYNDAVIEVYRNTSNGSAYYLEGTVSNSLTAATVTFTSTLSDVGLSSQAGDPYVPLVGQLANWGPLGCEIVATVGDRLWSAGGSIPPGQAQYSKLYSAGLGASHNDLVYADIIDTEGGKITSIGQVNDSVIVFQKDRVFVQQGSGPDNYGRGDWPPARSISAPGATCHTGTALVPTGLLFWSASGPQLFATNYLVMNISPEVRPLAETVTPTAVRVNASRMEVVWYTATGNALLWNYMGQDSRWAVWTGLFIAGGNQSYLVTTDGYLFAEGGYSDNGAPFEFAFATGHIKGEDLLAGYNTLRSVGIVGMYEGPHQLRCKIGYNESPVPSDSWIWDPTTNTWLTPGTTEASLTPAQVDAATWYDKSGQYMVHKRVSRQNCSFFQIEFSDGGATNATFVPFEVSLEFGVRPGLGRVATSTFTQ